MSSIHSGELSHIGIITIACSWTFTLLAFISLYLFVNTRRVQRKKDGIALEVDDFILITAFILTVLLVAQIT